jgi:hypothetical protein
MRPRLSSPGRPDRAWALPQVPRALACPFLSSPTTSQPRGRSGAARSRKTFPALISTVRSWSHGPDHRVPIRAHAPCPRARLSVPAPPGTGPGWSTRLSSGRWRPVPACQRSLRARDQACVRGSDLGPWSTIWWPRTPRTPSRVILAKETMSFRVIEPTVLRL